MTINDTQKSLIREEIMVSKLKEGFYPSMYLVDALVNEVFKNRPLGQPRFTYVEMKKGEASSSAEYNGMFKGAGQDLKVGYEETKRLNNRIMSLANYYESNRMKINKLLQGLELSAESLSMKASSSNNRSVIGDMINDFKMIDFRGNTKRNIPKTDAFVNLIQSDVEMKRTRNGTTKYDLSDADLSFKTSADHQVIHLSPMVSALADTIHESWRTIVVSKEAGEVSATFTIELKEVVRASNVTIDMQSGKPVHVALLVSHDGKEFVRLEQERIFASYQWVFESRDIKAIRFEMIKKEEDRPNGSEFEYIFGMKSVEMTETLYQENSYFVSKPFILPDHEAVKQISIDIDDYLPPDTSIRYYVGFDYIDEMIEWQEIRKDRPVVTDMVKPHKMEINRYTDGYAQMIAERFGTKFYQIAKLPHKPLKDSIKLMVGRNMWLKETIAAPFEYEETEDGTDVIVYPTGIHDWTRTPSTKKEYVRIQNGYDYLRSNKFHRYTTHIFSEEHATFDATVIGTSDTSHAVFVNGSQIKGVDNKYNLSLVPGWNKIQVYAYARILNQEIIIDFYIPALNNQIFASSTPMQELSMYDLLNNTTTRNINHFAVDENNGLIVNYDPKRLDVKGDFTKTASGQTTDKNMSLSDGVEYALDYEYSVSDRSEHSLRFMAIFTKEKEQIKVTPRIRGYKLIIE